MWPRCKILRRTMKKNDNLNRGGGSPLRMRPIRSKWSRFVCFIATNVRILKTSGESGLRLRKLTKEML